MAKSKREIDREIMFNKIMPSGAASANIISAIDMKNNPPAEEEPKPEVRKKKRPAAEDAELDDDTDADEDDAEDDASLDVKLSPQTKPAPRKSRKTEQESETDPVPAAPAVNGVGGVSVETIMVNVSEHAVLKKFDAAFEKFASCKCTRCRQDIIAMALNNIKPKYIITSREDVEKIVEKADSNEVMNAIMKAILYVKAHPRH
ncbi:MAG: late competence development ComFB family protein [Oscillospiraceae bacterium]